MSDVPNPRLVDFFEEYVPARKGRVKRRAAQKFAKEFALPIIKTGHKTLIDPVAGDAKLASFAQNQEPERRGRGRPRGS